MQELLDFEEAQALITPAEYRRYLEGVRMSALTLEALSADVNRPVLAEATALSPNVEVGDARLDPEEPQHPALQVDFVVRALARRKSAMRIKATYRLQLASEQELPPAFLAIYARVSTDVQVWPFLRELVHSLTYRMGLPPLMLPLHIHPGNPEPVKDAPRKTPAASGKASAGPVRG